MRRNLKRGSAKFREDEQKRNNQAHDHCGNSAMDGKTCFHTECIECITPSWNERAVSDPGRSHILFRKEQGVL